MEEKRTIMEVIRGNKKKIIKWTIIGGGLVLVAAALITANKTSANENLIEDLMDIPEGLDDIVETTTEVIEPVTEMID